MFFSSGGQNHNSINLLHFIILRVAGLSYIYRHTMVNKLHITLKKEPQQKNPLLQPVSEAQQKKRQTRGKANIWGWKCFWYDLEGEIGENVFSSMISKGLFSGRRLCAWDIRLLELHSFMLHFHSLPNVRVWSLVEDKWLARLVPSTRSLPSPQP